MDIKKVLFVAVTIITFCSLNVVSFASQTHNPIEILDYANEIGKEAIDTIPPSAREFLYEISSQDITIKSIIELGPKKIWENVKYYIKNLSVKPLKTFSTIAGLIIICAFIESASVEFMEKKLSTVFKMVSVICLSTTMVNPILSCIKDGAMAIEECSNFIKVLVPTMASILTVSGQPITATTYNVMLLAVCQVVSFIAGNVIVPLLSIYLAFCMVGSAMDEKSMIALAGGIKNIVNWALGLVMCLFVGFLTLQTFVESASDNLSIRATKFMITSFVPVVGSALSEAFAVTKGCMGFIKSAVGTFGTVIVAISFLPILVRICLWYIVIQVSSFIGEVLGVNSLSAMLKSSGNVLALILSLILSFVLLTIITTTLILMMGLGGT
ncbi:MAG: hypothetical protein RSD67_02685 [Oscillospiraceae bacterium]